MFVDEATIRVIGGKGGDGLTSFRREKFVAKGGPDGGDGGKGGDVIARADNNVNTLAKFRHSKRIAAKDGEHGKRRKAHGKNGDDMEIVLPVGTVVYEGSQLLADLDDIDSTFVLARGGRGGFGNAHFTTSVRQAPQMAELGEKGEEKELRLELKSVADVGLVGLPNAGKSTLLSVISNARPEIADYPFTTLKPNLGVVDIFENSLVVADIPGLIEGASKGKGLGGEFLRHIERTKVLLHLIDASQEDVVSAYKSILHELKSYKADLSGKPQIVVLTKSDAVAPEAAQSAKKKLQEASGTDVYIISSLAHKGLKEVLGKVLELVKSESALTSEAETPMPVLTINDDPKAWRVEKAGGEFVVYGQQIEGFSRRTDMSNKEAVHRLRDILHKRGIAHELERLGVQPKDVVRIAGKQLEW